jgi:hypothetical protein
MGEFLVVLADFLQLLSELILGIRMERKDL